MVHDSLLDDRARVQSEGVGNPRGDQTAPGFVHHRAVGDFIRQAGATRRAIHAPVAEETVVSRQLKIRVPAAIRRS